MNETQVVAVLIAIMVVFCTVPVAFFFYRRGKMDQEIAIRKYLQKMLHKKIEELRKGPTLMGTAHIAGYGDATRELILFLVNGDYDAKN